MVCSRVSWCYYLRLGLEVLFCEVVVLVVLRGGGVTGGGWWCGVAVARWLFRLARSGFVLPSDGGRSCCPRLGLFFWGC